MNRERTAIAFSGEGERRWIGFGGRCAGWFSSVFCICRGYLANPAFRIKVGILIRAVQVSRSQPGATESLFLVDRPVYTFRLFQCEPFAIVNLT